MGKVEYPIEQIEVSAYSVPTESPESDGTAAWDTTTIVLVELTAGEQRSVGYTYSHVAAATLIDESLASLVRGQDAMDIPAIWRGMVDETRNLGRPGIVSSAISAVDNSLWDLKGKLLGVPVVTLLGSIREGVLAYGSGGFTSYSIKELQDQLGGWAEQGLTQVKMKVGREPDADPERVRAAREAIGPDVQLFVDANGAYHRKQALAEAEEFEQQHVTWFEEPVTANDPDGLHLLRERGPAGMAIAAGEYGYDLPYFLRLLQWDAVDVLQADATRCGGITLFLQAAALAEAHAIPFSAHTAPSLHVHPCCSVRQAWNVEYFYDHVRIEHMFFDGAATPREGYLYPDHSRPGLGLEFRRADAAKFKIYGHDQ